MTNMVNKIIPSSKEVSESLTMIKLRRLENKFGRLIPLEILEKEEDSLSGIKGIRVNIKSLIEKDKLYSPRKGFVVIRKEKIITKDLIEAEWCDCVIEHRGTEEDSRIFCDKIEYLHHKGNDKLFGDIFDHHLMFWKNEDLVFKVWLPNDGKNKEFKDIFEAMKSCGIKCLVREDKQSFYSRETINKNDNR